MSRVSRRNFLKMSAALGAGLGFSRSLPAFARNVRLQDTELLMWWWGEQELPGLQQFVDDSIAAYTDARIEAVLQDTSVVISQFQTASAANEAPDIQYLWNGIYHMESVWFGYLEPLNGLVDQTVLDVSTPTLLSNYGGNVYRVGWYPLPMVWYYNKELYDQAGLDADNPPKTWDEFLDACDKLKGAGIAPVGGGIQDGFWGEWYLGHGLVQNLDSVGEALDLFIGERDFREPKYHEFWTKLEELVSLGFINEEMSSLELYPGIDLVVTGQLAMGESIGSRVPADNAALNGNLGVMVMPVYGTGALAGKPILDVQGLGISSQSDNKEAAAAFLEFLHSPDRLTAFWETTQWMPSNTGWDASVIEDPVVKFMWDNWNLGENIPYISNLVPGQFYTDALLPNAQEIIAGNRTGEEAGEVAAQVVEDWRAFNPDLLENYQTWGEDLR
ncbi:MAG: extracellular solute-binding protein [Anaerolineae bacterium]|nr:extracellular solute-binding protein [Anaerolineae bacterium]